MEDTERGMPCVMAFGFLSFSHDVDWGRLLVFDFGNAF